MASWLGAAGDPAAGFSGADMTRLYIENPGPLQWKSTGYHWAYALWMLPALLTLPYTRRKGAWLGNLAALIGFAGLVSLPGMLVIVVAFASILGMQMSLRCRKTVVAVMSSLGIVAGLCTGLGWCGYQCRVRSA